MEEGGDGNARRSLQLLLEENAEAIAQIRQRLSRELAREPPQGEPLAYDDIFLLRYALSFHENRGGVPAAAAAARKAIGYRRTNADLIQAAVKREAPPGFSDRQLAAFEAFAVVSYHNVSLLGDPLLIFRSGCCEPVLLMNELSIDEMALLMTYVSECCYQWIDWKTRQEGYLVKLMSVMDMTQTTYHREGRMNQAISLASRRHEWLYPQKDSTNTVWQPPRWMHWAFSLFKVFLTRGFTEKVYIHRPVPVLGERGCDLRLCPFASQLFHTSDVPLLLGGRDTGGVKGVPDAAAGDWAARCPGVPWECAYTRGAKLRHLRLLPCPGDDTNKVLPVSNDAYWGPRSGQPPWSIRASITGRIRRLSNTGPVRRLSSAYSYWRGYSEEVEPEVPVPPPDQPITFNIVDAPALTMQRRSLWERCCGRCCGKQQPEPEALFYGEGGSSVLVERRALGHRG